MDVDLCGWGRSTGRGGVARARATQARLGRGRGRRRWMWALVLLAQLLAVVGEDGEDGEDEANEEGWNDAAEARDASGGADTWDEMGTPRVVVRAPFFERLGPAPAGSQDGVTRSLFIEAEFRGPPCGAGCSMKTLPLGSDLSHYPGRHVVVMRAASKADFQDPMIHQTQLQDVAMWLVEATDGVENSDARHADAVTEVRFPLAVPLEVPGAPPTCEISHMVRLVLRSASGGVLSESQTFFWTPPKEHLPTLVIYHHLGLGDHIVAAGLVRSLAREHKLVKLVAMANYSRSVARLFRDVPNVEILAVEDEYQVMHKRADYFLEAHGAAQLRLGFHKHASSTGALLTGGLSFAELFYRHGGLPYASRWEHWHLSRDQEAEAKAIALARLDGGLPAEGGEYAFLHDDPRREFVIDRSAVRKGLHVYHPNEGSPVSNVIFDYAAMLEGATELHLMDSSFALLADHLDLSRVQRKVLHVYVRLNEDGTPQVQGHVNLYQHDWELLHHLPGVALLEVDISHPPKGGVVRPGTPSPEEYGIEDDRRLTFSWRDLAHLPAGADVQVFEDGQMLLQVPLINGEGPYRRGHCRFQVGGQDSMSFAVARRCDIDIYMPPLSPGTHSVEVRIRGRDGSISSLTNTFTFDSEPLSAEEGGRDAGGR